MADPAFRADQLAHLRDPHVAPINDFVDEIRVTHGWTPYVAPLHGGVNARMLTVLRDPGNMTRDVGGGSGMICVENDDQTAEKKALLMEGAGLTPAEFTPWNAVPWWVGNRAPTTAELHEATPTLVRLLELLPKLEVVLLQGHHAKLAWKYARQAEPPIRHRRLRVIETYHPSVMALRTPDADERAWRIEHREDAWQEAAAILHG